VARGCVGQFLWLEKWQRWWFLGRKEKRMTNGDQITANGGHGGRQNYVGDQITANGGHGGRQNYVYH